MPLRSDSPVTSPVELRALAVSAVTRTPALLSDRIDQVVLGPASASAVARFPVPADCIEGRVTNVPSELVVTLAL
jgi:hypothetical protein